MYFHIFVPNYPSLTKRAIENKRFGRYQTPSPQEHFSEAMVCIDCTGFCRVGDTCKRLLKRKGPAETAGPLRLVAERNVLKTIVEYGK